MEIEYNELRGLLQNNLLKILFVKKDGTEREMYCTLMPETIKHTFSPDRQKKPPTNQTRTIAVFDTQIQGWRSMIVENIISYSVVKQ
jgi:hypothetical protein